VVEPTVPKSGRKLTSYVRRRVVTITKLDAGKRNLAAAIKLFFEHGDAVAVHTLAAAAQAVMRDIATARTLEHTSILHDNPMVPDETRADWHRAINAPRNFFKHANKDPQGTIEFDEKTNAQLLLDASLILTQLDKQALREASVFPGWFTIANPELGLSKNAIGDYCVRNRISPDDFEQYRELCDTRLLLEPLRIEDDT